MYKYVLAGALTALLCACSGSEDASPQAPPPPATAASTAEAADNPEQITPPRSVAELSADMLDKALDSKARSQDDKALDKVRHPRRTLGFFGLRPDMNVIEVGPADGWYAAILAPLLRDHGTYTAALVSPLSDAGAGRTRAALRGMFNAHPARYGRARLATFDPHTPNLGTPGSADMVLSLRSAHVWVAQGRGETMMRAIYDVLAPGGVFGVVENRAPDETSDEELKGKPYLRQKDVVALAEQAGFILDAHSAINAHEGDEGLADKAPVDADRMTLRFVKPGKPAHAASS